jgi:hypothetical protein
MKKLITGAVCAATIAAAVVVLLPVAAVRSAGRLSTPRDAGRAERPEADRIPLAGGAPPAEPNEMPG